MKLVYPEFREVRAHLPGENHKWWATWNRLWMCEVCGCILNRRTAQILREGKRNEG